MMIISTSGTWTDTTIYSLHTDDESDACYCGNVVTYDEDTPAIIKIDDKWGFVNANGKIIIEPQYDSAGCFSNGLARVLVGEKWGFIDSDGDFVILPTYDYAEDFEEDGTALVTVNNGESYSDYYIDNQGRHLSEADYDTDDIG